MLFICIYILVHVSGVDCIGLPCSQKVQKAGRCTFTAQDADVCTCITCFISHPHEKWHSLGRFFQYMQQKALPDTLLLYLDPMTQAQ